MHEISPAAVGKVLLIGAQLGLLILIVKLFQIQNTAFLDVSILVLFGFLIHSFLPMRFRLAFFLALSLASIVLVLGVKSGAWVIGLGLVLIGVCYLPVKFSVRVALILLAGGLLAAVRVGWISAPWAVGVWPILGAMFMFRLIIYLYDINHEKGRPDLIRTLSYFFMLPNVVFPLFPVVDYKKFQRSYYNEEPVLIYQRGVSWILRGLIHLLLYRVAYQNFTIDPVIANGLTDVLQFSFSAFLLYFQVSGSFHMIVGILLLFGFNLPETNHLYFLASSFNDFWRRINIYWKDFMMKVFYYPVYFRLRKLGETKAIIISTLIVFFATWFLHAYQWFWLRGVFLLEWHDGLYWAILAFLVIGNSLYEMKYGRDRKLGTQTRTLLDYVALGSSILGTFLTMGVLWGMWSSDSLEQWVSIWQTTGSGWFVMLLLIPGLFALSIVLGNLAKRRKTEVTTLPSKPKVVPVGFWKKGFSYTAIMGLIYVGGHEAVYSQLPSGASTVMETFRVVQLNTRDQAQLERGYYENLISVNRHGTELWGMLANKPDDWGWTDANIKYTRLTNDLRHRHLLPNVEFMLKGGKVKSNRWGMRDQDYEMEKPENNTIRIALLGASHTFGSGVNNEQTFDAVLEERLNTQESELTYEVLNFSFPKRDAVNQVPVLEMDVLQFQPDVILYIEHPRAARRLIRNLSEKITDGVDIKYDYLKSVAERANVDKDLPLEVVRNRMAPFSEEILQWSYEQIVKISQERGILPLWAHLPATNQRFEKENLVIVTELSLARNAGFKIISLINVYDKYDPSALAVAKWDKHPNALAHRLVGESLYDVLTERREEIFGLAGEPIARANN